MCIRDSFFTKGGAIDRFCAAARVSGGRVLVIPAPPLDSDTATAIRSHHTERLNRQVSSVETLRTAIAALTTAKKRVSEEKWVGMMLQRILSLFACLLYTSDAADDLLCVDLGGPRLVSKKNQNPLYHISC
eukprot:TRINITY_DN28204_c0_g1_i1.p1 TRINITY_DN28204_c0_g1~~TRINITY_DN28204_c0_g1_i1.p1  ORF type:complete len:131 (-),score=37.80 TRINITY_DN28204_c0_g1_i1:29-421(-)